MSTGGRSAGGSSAEGTGTEGMGTEGMGTEGAGTAHRVMRQDDNGNRYLVAKGLGRAEAEALAAEFEARGHKQMYWVERDDA